MSTQAPTITKQSPKREKFDLNSVRVSGNVRRIWPSGDDILLRLAAGDEDAPTTPRLTVLIPGGCVNGEPVTLMKEDWISVTGHLVEAPYTETGRQFAERSRKESLLQDVPGLSNVSTERMATYIVVETLEYCGKPAAPVLNEAKVEGIVSSVTQVENQIYVRLAIYDEHTSVRDGKTGKDGRPWRKAHYISVHFVDGRVNGRTISLKEKDRVRVSGQLSERRYSETLAAFLMRAKQIGLLSKAINADDVRVVRTPRTSTYVQASAMLQFTK